MVGSDEVLVVRRDGVPLLGISGYTLETLPGAAEVACHGQRGPYTIIAWRGRMGFVLTDELRDPSEPALEMNDVIPEGRDGEESDASGRWLTALFGMSVVAGGAGVVYLLLGG